MTVFYEIYIPLTNTTGLNHRKFVAIIMRFELALLKHKLVGFTLSQAAKALRESRGITLLYF